MRKNLFLLVTAITLLMSGCSENAFERVANGAPIKPVHMQGNSAQIYLTDYVPLLAADSLVPEIMTVTGNKLQVFNIENINIAVLPDKPMKTGLMAECCKQGKVKVSTESKNCDIIALVQNHLAPVEKDSEGHYIITIAPKLKGRSFLRVYAADSTYMYNDLLIPLEDGKPVTDAALLTRHDDEAQVLYSLMVDRFANGNPNNDWKMNNPEVLDIVDYQGGDFAGITAKIEEGFFDELGINTIWVSPITQNPWDAWGKYVFQKPNKYDPSKKFTRFSGYHGYWPIYATKVEIRFGTEQELRDMLAAAHKHNINVILDYVANHLHINSPTYAEHPTWHTDSILPDGRRNFELWDEQRLTTWFDVHIPTLDLEREDVCQPMTDSALYWLANFDFDGFRHDACKHIPEGYWRLLGQKMAARFPNRHIWMIGETYGSPQLIGSYVKTGMLNSQFDFNMYFAIRDALVKGESFENINKTVLESMAAYGAHHTMGNISGNHDQIRFASMAGEAIGTNTNGKEEGWTEEIGIGNAEKAYIRALQQEALNLTLPGVPCIYQGDEYAEVGGNDPDNRHMMKFDGLNEKQLEFKEAVQELIKMRRSSMALMYGEYVPVTVTKDTLVFDRIYFDQSARVTIMRDQPVEITL